MKNKIEEIEQFLFIEDGSVDVEDLEQSIKDSGLPIKIVVYKAGSQMPKLVDIYQ